MADQQEFNRLFTELKVEVADLLSKRMHLPEEIATLEARKKFLNESVDDITVTLTQEKQKRQDSLKELEGGIASAGAVLSATNRSLEGLYSKLRLAESDIETMQKSTDEEVLRLDDVIVSKKAAITGFLEEIVRSKAELTTIQEEIADSKEVARVLDKEVSTRAEEVAKEIEGIELDLRGHQEKEKKTVESLNEAIVRNNELVKEVDEAEERLKGINEECGMLSRQREIDIKSLDAREASITAREEELETKIARASRPGGILGNAT